ncbi:hypothetical protein THRCLA_21272 [Thraustotheca clavata]|uniref:Uncharacterized protein n=1 Tax=Thraustotheca clavata TaxID=74557 RepID=A0A1V9ZYD5_9STRA|nr:hypothetical protein THRCLA_21272 [Thraustotheca clavata]
MFHMRQVVKRSARYIRRHPTSCNRMLLNDVKSSGFGRRALTMAPRIGAVAIMDVIDAIRSHDVDQVSLMYHSLVDDDGR